MITGEQIVKIMPYAAARVGSFIAPLNSAMQEFHINTADRQAAFLAQIAVESGELRYVLEIASGSAYEGRSNLGNTQPGDGVRYKGRGLIQITGRSNYDQCGRALGVDLITNPEELETKDLACRSAAWFWASRGLNDLADKGEFERITKRINGGTNGAQQRRDYHDRARKVFGLAP